MNGPLSPTKLIPIIIDYATDSVGTMQEKAAFNDSAVGEEEEDEEEEEARDTVAKVKFSTFRISPLPLYTFCREQRWLNLVRGS